MLTREVISRIFTRIPTLETERLLLRKIGPEDVDDMFAYASRKEVTEYLLWSPHETREYTAHYIDYLGRKYRTGDFYDWALVLKDEGKMIGTCGFTAFTPGANAGEVGYVLNPDFWGKGLATEAVARVVRFGFEALELHRLEARYMMGNEASRRVMAHVGMHFDGCLRHAVFVRGKYRDVGICSILEDEFYNKQ